MVQNGIIGEGSGEETEKAAWPRMNSDDPDIDPK